VVIAALTPILVSGHSVSGHELWLACSLLALIFFAQRRASAPSDHAGLAAQGGSSA